MQVFSKAVRYVVISAVAVLGFFRDHPLQIFLALMAVAGVVWFIRKVISCRHRLKAWWQWKMASLEEASAKRRQERAKHYRQKEREKSVVDTENASQPVVAYQEDQQTRKAAVRQLNCRITDRIQAVFPEATWEWVSPDPVGIAVHGGEGRIRISSADAYNYADVSVNAMARLKLTMLQAVELDKIGAKEKGEEPEAESAPAEKESVDVRAWCDLVGRGPLYALSSRLAEKGFHTLSICEDGSIYAVSGEEKTPQFKLGDMPEKKFWPALARLLSDSDHQAAVEGDALVLKW